MADSMLMLLPNKEVATAVLPVNMGGYHAEGQHSIARCMSFV